MDLGSVLKVFEFDLRMNPDKGDGSITTVSAPLNKHTNMAKHHDLYISQACWPHVLEKSETFNPSALQNECTCPSLKSQSSKSLLEGYYFWLVGVLEGSAPVLIIIIAWCESINAAKWLRSKILNSLNSCRQFTNHHPELWWSFRGLVKEVVSALKMHLDQWMSMSRETPVPDLKKKKSKKHSLFQSSGVREKGTCHIQGIPVANVHCSY